MTRFLTFILAIVLLVSCGSKDGYTIKGEYLSAPDGTMLYMSSYEDILAVVDSAVVKNGRFEFSGCTQDLNVCFISSAQVIDGGFVVVEPGDINFSFGRGTRCSGTPNNAKLAKFMYERDKISVLDRMGSGLFVGANGVGSSLSDSLSMVIDLASRIFDAYAVGLIKENTGNALGCFFLVQSVGHVNPLTLFPLFDSVPSSCRNRHYEAKRKVVEREIENMRDSRFYVDEAVVNAVSTAVGKKFVDFELNSISGEKILFSDRVSSNRYTVLFFWAGWNSASMADVERLAGFYGKYKSRGADVVAVSLDRTVEECSNTVDRCGVEWVNLCNPSGGSAEVAAAYGVTSLPAYVLVNRSGTIITRGASMDDIRHKLDEVLK